MRVQGSGFRVRVRVYGLGFSWWALLEEQGLCRAADRRGAAMRHEKSNLPEQPTGV